MNEEQQKEISECLTKLKFAMKNQKRYCEVDGCVAQYIEHWHIDKYTLTFLSPEELDDIRKKSTEGG